jgi:iron complex transport system substrate-binding protein
MVKVFQQRNRKKWIFIIGLLFVFSLVIAGCQDNSETDSDDPSENEEAVQEDTQEETTQQEALAYENIVVDSPSIAHYMALYDIPLVGIPTSSKPMPEEYEGVTEIGIAVEPNIETIVSLDPDLFVGDQVLEQFSKEQVESHDIETLYLDNSTYDAVFESILTLGETFGLEEKGEEYIEEAREKEAEVLEEAESLEGEKVALVMGTAESYQLATNNSYLGSILEKIGVENVAEEIEDTDQEYVTFSKESLVAANPDYILALAHGGDPAQVEASFQDEFESDFWNDTTAKMEHQIYYLDSLYFPVTGSIDNVEVLERVVDLLEQGTFDESEE